MFLIAEHGRRWKRWAISHATTAALKKRKLRTPLTDLSCTTGVP